MFNNFFILVTSLERISDYSDCKMFPGDITIFIVSLSVIGLKPCLNGVFNIYIYLYAVQLTSGGAIAQ